MNTWSGAGGRRAQSTERGGLTLLIFIVIIIIVVFLFFLVVVLKGESSTSLLGLGLSPLLAESILENGFKRVGDPNSRLFYV